MTTAPWVVAAALAAAAAALGTGGPAGRLDDLQLPRHGRARSSSQPEPARTSRRRTQQAASAESAASVASSLALELRSGRDLAAALAAVAAEHRDSSLLYGRLSAAAAAAATGADPGPALTADVPVAGPAVGRSAVRSAALQSRTSRSSRSALQATASCLSAGRRSGLPVAELLDSVASAASAAAELESLARAELAGARASALLLAGLPLAGLGLGQLLGAAPVRFLISGGWGLACLVLALLLTLAGWSWTQALTRSLMREITP